MAGSTYGGKKFGGNKFGGNKLGGNTYGGNKYGASAPAPAPTQNRGSPKAAPSYAADTGDETAPANTPTSYNVGNVGKGISDYFKSTALGKALSGGATDSASAATSTPKKPGSPFGPMGSGVQQNRGSAKAAPSYGKPATGVTSGSITAPSKAYKASQKAAGDAYLANSSTDYGMGSAINSFVNKKGKK